MLCYKTGYRRKLNSISKRCIRKYESKIMFQDPLKTILGQLFYCKKIETLLPHLILETNNNTVGGGDTHPNLSQGIK